MALRVMPRVRRLGLSTISLPEHHPAAPLGRSVPVYGFLIERLDGPILVDTGVGFGNDAREVPMVPAREVPRRWMAA